MQRKSLKAFFTFLAILGTILLMGREVHAAPLDPAAGTEPRSAAHTPHTAAENVVWVWAGGGQLYDVSMDMTFAGEFGWLAGSHGTLARSTDGGVTWEGQYAGPLDITIYGVAATDANQAWAVGYDGTTGVILNTADGGATWTSQASNANWRFRYDNITFVDNDTGWVVGADQSTAGPALVLHTSDGGATWTPQASYAPEPLYGVAFVDANNGWAVGDGGVIVHTQNGGTTWLTQTSGTTRRG